MSALMLRSKLACTARANAGPAARPVVPRIVARAVQQQDQPQQQQQQERQPALSMAVPPALAVAAANLMIVLPASAEAGKLFDFNLTLPAMAGQFLLLMVMLDKLWFSPVGKVLDERDALIRGMLAGVKDSTGNVDAYAQEAQEILRQARADVTKMIAQQKNAKQAELDKQYAEAKARITREVDSSIAAVEAESQAMLAKLDAQVDKISGEVLRRVLPEGVKV